tara:strand:+ start:186 stop:881 length:696 start_codon:yes stop_codon:yes gene_type:complete
MIHIILVEPENPGNIGAIARVMKNFDQTNLFFVNPKCDVKDIEALKRSKQGLQILEKATTIQTEDLKKFDYLIGTTAKLGTDYNIQRTPLSPWELADKIANVTKTKIGILIGRESFGLTNEELSLCDFIVNIPSSRKYPTLNVSHSVGILLYELFKIKSVRRIKPISAEKKNMIHALFEELLNSLSFSTDKKKNIQVNLWKKIIGKSLLSERESLLVLGFLRKIMKALKRL